MGENTPVDAAALREEVKKKYREVAVEPHGDYHFHSGRPLAKRLGYDDHVVAALPDAAVESFAGVGNRRVEDWRASLRVRWLFRRFRSGPQSGSHGHVSSPRSSNRTCGFPASGFRTRSCLRTRKAQCVPRQTGEAVFFV